MKKESIDVSFRDERGEIIDILSGEEVNAVTMVTFRKGAVRGNHHHKLTTQWNYLLSGELLVRTKTGDAVHADTILKPGDMIVTYPNERHALVGLEDSTLLVLTKGPRGGKEYESDTYRDEDPLYK